MSSGGKFWGGILGLMFGGPLGAIAGIYIGHKIDSAVSVQSELNPRAVFEINLLSILAYVARVDGQVDPREVDTIVHFFRRAGFALLHLPRFEQTLQFALTQDINLEETCRNFRQAVNYESRLMLLRVVYLVAMADQKLTASEKNAIEQIARYLEISSADFEMLQAEFHAGADKDYQILGLQPGADLEAVKKAYRALALQYHPDRVSHLGPEYARIAEEKFKIINEAYRKITEELQPV